MKNVHKKIKQKMFRGNRALAVFVFAAIVFFAVFIGLGSVKAEARSSRSSRNRAQEFFFSDFSADYELSRDSGGHSVLKVRENLTAEFSDDDTNHGIERAIPVSFDGHPIFDGNLKVLRNGQPEKINDTNFDGENKVFQIGDSDKYLHGSQEYQLEYELKDVVKDGEFFWLANGGSWKQPFYAVNATLKIVGVPTKYFMCAAGNSDQISAEKNNGFKGSDGCNIDVEDTNTVKYSATNGFLTPLNPGESLAFGAGGIPRGTFVDFAPNGQQIFAKIAVWAAGIITGIFAIFTAIFAFLRGRSSRSKRAIIPQYEPPKDVDILDIARIYSSQSDKRVLSAVLLKLAVYGNIEIIAPNKEKGEKKFSIRLIKKDGADEVSLKYLNAFFSGDKKEFSFAKTNASVGTQLAKIFENDRKNFIKSEYFRKEKALMWVSIAAILTAISCWFFLTIITSFAWAQWNEILDPSSTAYANSFVLFIVGIVGVALRPRSEKGTKLNNHVLGLKMFIKTAESERIKFLQSAKTVELTDENVAKLYEKLLPYAELFGLEKTWSKVLADKYPSGSSPRWYVGSGDFSAAMFVSSMASLSSSSGIGSYSGGSGSGVSGGGGFGGAGGGGGGGGW